MSQQSVRNKHLKQTIDHAKVYLDDGEDIPVELFFNLVNELKVSNLIIPLFEDSDGINFENVNFEEDDLTFMPLFTDIDEYDAYIEKDSEFNPVTFDFSQYVDLVKESELDGIIINIEGKHLPLENDLLENIYFESDIADESDVEAYTASELKDLSQNVSNDSLVELLTMHADCGKTALLVYPAEREAEEYYVPVGVERIAGRAFEGARYLRRVVLSDTVTHIGGGAFRGCVSLEEIVIPASVTVFEDNGWTEAISDWLVGKVTIVTPAGSAAEAYAIEHGFDYRNE